MFELLPGAVDLGPASTELGDLGAHQFLPSVTFAAVCEKLADLAEAEPGVLPHANHEHSIHGFGRVPALT